MNTYHVPLYRRRAVQMAMLVAAPVALVAAACGGGGSGNNATPGGAGSPSPVAVKTIGSSGSVLVDRNGKALYSPVQESSGTIKCTQSCTAVWPPLTVSGGKNVAKTAPGASGTVGTTQRPGGGTQVTFNGHPLYTFANDTSPGTVTGNGAHDSFGGTHFTWHVVHAGGGKPSNGGNTGGY